MAKASIEIHLRLIWEESRGWIGDGKHRLLPIQQIIADLRLTGYAKDEVDRLLLEGDIECI